MSIQKILGQNGFSMVQVIIAAGLMGGLALVMAKLGENQSKIQRKAHQNFESIQATNTLEYYLSKSDTCNDILAGKTITSAGAIAATTSLLDIANLEVTVNGVTRNISQQISSPKLQITEAYLSQLDGTPVGNGESGPVELRVRFSRDGDASKMGIFKKFPLFVTLNSLGEVTECYSNEGNYVQEAMIQFCQDQFDGTWDTSATPNECKVDGMRVKEWIESLSGGSCGVALADDCSASNCCTNTLVCQSGSCECTSGLVWDSSLTMCHIDCPSGEVYNPSTDSCDTITCASKTVYLGPLSGTLPTKNAGESANVTFSGEAACPPCDPGQVRDKAMATYSYSCQNSGNWSSGSIVGEPVCLCI